MKTFLKSTILAASLLGALSTASAETLRVRIPFGFSADGSTMPAGSYAIYPLPNAPSVLLFENEGTKVKTMVFARSGAGLPIKTESPLTFTANSSERVELTSIATAGWTYELSSHSPRGLPKGVALTLTSSGK